MTQEDKELLLKDLCARLPWVKITSFKNGALSPYLIDFRDGTIHTTSDFNDAYVKVKLEDCKLYLRPMSSMTEDERLELVFILNVSYTDVGKYGIKFMLEHGFLGYDEMSKLLDWLNSHHFDYRGLIEKGLALEAPEGMYK